MIVREATPEDAALLHRVAAATFALACPPNTPSAGIEQFIATNLSLRSFAHYLVDPQRELFVAEVEEVAAGYAMIVHGEPADADAAGAVKARPTAELSKLYVLEQFHGAGVAVALVESSVAAAKARGARSMWLGVNQENARANRFYEKNGFARAGTKRFLVGDSYHHDFVRERML